MSRTVVVGFHSCAEAAPAHSAADATAKVHPNDLIFICDSLPRSHGIDGLGEAVVQRGLRPFGRLDAAAEQHRGGAHALALRAERRGLDALVELERGAVQ